MFLAIKEKKKKKKKGSMMSNTKIHVSELSVFGYISGIYTLFNTPTISTLLSSLSLSANPIPSIVSVQFAILPISVYSTLNYELAKIILKY